MRLERAKTHVDFVSDEGRRAGRYVYLDPHKPYVHPLMSPAGHLLSLFSPHDHKHHKGLMYALRTRDVNFWEEYVTQPGEMLGRQRHEAFEELDESAEGAKLRQRLTWLADDGTLTTFDETRELACRVLPEHRGFEWSWRTTLHVQRDVTLIMSQFSLENAKGGKVNYHGLGLRLRRDFGCTGGNRLVVDGAEVPFAAGLGAIPGTAAFEGSIDGTTPSMGAGVCLRQAQGNALFVLETPFAFLSLGPSNVSEVPLARGDTVEEEYSVRVYDCEPPPRGRST